MSSGSYILIADTAEGCLVLQSALASEFATTCVTTMSELNEAIRQRRPDLVVCGCHFDEGRMYEALRLLRVQPPRTAFLAVRALSGELDDAVYEGVKIATRALDGDGFVDLFRWRRKYGAESANERLVALVRQLVAANQADTQWDSTTD